VTFLEGFSLSCCDQARRERTPNNEAVSFVLLLFLLRLCNQIATTITP